MFSKTLLKRSLGADNNVWLTLSAVLVLACTGTAQKTSSVSSSAETTAPVALAIVPTEKMDAWFAASVDRLNGGQFVELLDPIMDGQLSRIMEAIKRKSPESFNRLVAVSDIPARQFLSILDNLSGGQVSAAFSNSFPSTFGRPRRASLDTMSGLSLGYSKKSLDPMSGVSFGAPSKRNFDEIDRTGFSGFAKRRSEFDELDRSGFSGFAKRRSEFDELDRTGFSGFAKRRSNEFDELDRSGFSGFAKRRSNEFDEMDRSGFSGFAKRFNFDELDRYSGFTGFMHKRRLNPVASMAMSRSKQQAAAMEASKSQPESASAVKQQTKA